MCIVTGEYSFGCVRLLVEFLDMRLDVCIVTREYSFGCVRLLVKGFSGLRLDVSIITGE